MRMLKLYPEMMPDTWALFISLSNLHLVRTKVKFLSMGEKMIVFKDCPGLYFKEDLITINLQVETTMV